MKRRFLQKTDVRVSFICCDRSARRDWSFDRSSEPLVALDDPLQAIELLAHAPDEYGWDVSRVIIDQQLGELEFLEFLAQVPQSFRGDILFIANGQRAFLSAVGRHADRILYALSCADVDFYLATTLSQQAGLRQRLAPLRVAC